MLSLALTTWIGCGMVPTAVTTDVPALAGQDVKLTILHTSDIHSRLLEYDFDPSFTDNTLGLADGAGPYGGMAEMAYLLKRERADAGRVLHLDSGDCFQGAIIFNEFYGEAEVRALSLAGLDAAVIGNHEFDAGAHNLAAQASAYAEYDLLASNYDFESSDEPWATLLEEISLPSNLYELDGLRVGVVGMANLSSLNSIHDEDNSQGVTVIPEHESLKNEAAKLREQGAEIIIAVSHMGLDDDLEMAQSVPGVDLFIGGHHHVAIDPPLVVTNEHSGREVPVVHSGAFAKFIGRLDVVIRDGEILSHAYELFPIDNTVPRDPDMVELLEEYEQHLDQHYETDQVIGYAADMNQCEDPNDEACWVNLTRYGTTGGDSMLGNFTADAMRRYQGVETEIAITNTLGIRADINGGAITLEDLFNSMPFDNTITTMFLSGREIQEVLDYVTRRSSERGCNSQAQVAGLTFTMDCREQVAADIIVNGVPLDPDGTYEVATNNYIAHGGSGFSMLERNTTQYDTGVSIRDVVREAITSYYTLPQEGVCVEDGRIQAVY